MLLRYVYNDKLAHASYLVGCQATGEAIVVDPGQNIEPYLKLAKEQGVRIVAATETHIHADFVSGARELAKREGAKLYLSDEGDENWKYQYLNDVPHQLVKDGDTFKIGNLIFQVMHTPGHTPESISFLLTDTGGGADKPMGIFSGDFVFVGDVGRPDLLEKAAGVQGSSDIGARQMFNSLKRFKELPDYLQLWPAHGAGSACGKALGAVPSSTVGYEKMFNWALSYEDENEFVKALLDGQPAPPKYFAMMKKVNKEGPMVTGEMNEPQMFEASKEKIEQLLDEQAVILDIRSNAAFADGHIPGTLNIPLNKSFTTWAGWLLSYTRPLYVLADPNKTEEIKRDLYSIGFFNINGFIDSSVLKQYQNLQTYENKKPAELAEAILNNEVHVIDVRNDSEWNEGHLPNAQHIMLGYLEDRLETVPKDKTIVMQCKGGGRSAIASSVMQAHGITSIINLEGGYDAWVQQGYRVEN
ncbi:MBL fold metallo-hydrolase [Ferviditalea candida]|uniref:MBL fold metallo-hydrolase n=1 Tax=Ferviditalea candida TaxID=3108399 RepID=A0ABU5ZJB2_9BACL|nr:MBL fold metallo-hydrolase [Paenibacillaceae bacterium T2]